MNDQQGKKEISGQFDLWPTADSPVCPPYGTGSPDKPPGDVDMTEPAPPVCQSIAFLNSPMVIHVSVSG